MEDTLRPWTTEFGPCRSQGSTAPAITTAARSSPVAGGIKGGVARESDEFSYQAVVDKSYCYDLHAPSHLLGIDHES